MRLVRTSKSRGSAWPLARRRSATSARGREKQEARTFGPHPQAPRHRPSRSKPTRIVCSLLIMFSHTHIKKHIHALSNSRPAPGPLARRLPRRGRRLGRRSFRSARHHPARPAGRRGGRRGGFLPAGGRAGLCRHGRHVGLGAGAREGLRAEREREGASGGDSPKQNTHESVFSTLTLRIGRWVACPRRSWLRPPL